MPFIIFGLIILSLIGVILSKNQTVYKNKKYKYSIEFPKGWVKSYNRDRAVSYRSPDVISVSQEPEAAVVIVANDRMGGMDLMGHYRSIVNDLKREKNFILNEGVTLIDMQEARWVEFKEETGTNNHVWYVFFNYTDKLMIIQSKVSIFLVDKYRDSLQQMLENVRLRD